MLTKSALVARDYQNSNKFDTSKIKKNENNKRRIEFTFESLKQNTITKRLYTTSMYLNLQFPTLDKEITDQPARTE